MKNRFYQTPHCTGFGSDRPGAQAYFRAMKAEGGWAAVNTEWCSIHPEADEVPAVAARLWDDHDVRNLSLLCERVHELEALVGVELGYGGPHATHYETRGSSRGVSQIPSDALFFHTPRTMNRREIRELRGFYVDAAKRARTAGFDLVNVMGAEAAGIPQQFLMPYFNKRTDEYGGTFENRARFWRETIEDVKAAVGNDCAIVVRLCIDTLHDGEEGIRVGEEGVGFIELADHLVDLWDLQVGGRTIVEWGDDAGSSRFFPENFQRLWVEQVRPYTKKPIVGVGRFTSPDTMVAVIQSGQLDVIGAARATIADPFLPKKIEEGRLDEIRECIGCNICASRYEQNVTIVCTQNATVGEEYRRGWHPERFDRAENWQNDVLIVGAGPAGMECAMVLGKRGMRRVHLVDTHADMGGIMRWIPELPGLREWARVVNYRKRQIAKLRNVDFIPETTLDARSVAEYGAEFVIVATGSFWAGDGLNGCTHDTIPGADHSRPNILTPDQIMCEGKEVPGQRVLVYDCDGYFMAASLSERLARQGKTVTFVTPMSDIAPYMHFTLEGTRMTALLHELGVVLQPHHLVTKIEPGVVTGTWTLGPDRVVRWAVDAIVLVTQRLSNETLFRELDSDFSSLESQGVKCLYRIGDCAAPRLVADCIFDGHRLAREIDTDNPDIPSPFIRERRLLGTNDAEYDAILGHGRSSQPSSLLSAGRSHK